MVSLRRFRAARCSSSLWRVEVIGYNRLETGGSLEPEEAVGVYVVEELKGFMKVAQRECLVSVRLTMSDELLNFIFA
jgi:hypothetical protein